MEKPDGGYGIALTCWPYLEVAPNSPDRLHTVAHEAFHVVTGQRDEKLGRLRDRQSDDASRRLADIAGWLVEEYRVERAALEYGARPDESLARGLNSKIAEARQLLRSAVAQRSADLNASLVEAFGIFADLARECTWAAAEELATAGHETPDTDPPGWNRLVGNHYKRLREALRRIPSAAHVTSREVLEHSAEALIPLLQDWLRQVGVSLEGSADRGVTVSWVWFDF